MRQKEEQHIDGLDEDIQRLNNEADGVVQLAIREKDKDLSRADEIYEEALNRIREDIFHDGCLGPATAAADPMPYLERLGEAFGKFEERVISDELDLRLLIEVAQRAASTLGENKYIIGRRVDTPAGPKYMDLKTNLAPDKALHKLEAAGVTMDNLVHLDILEPYFDVFRGQVFYDPKKRLLSVKGRTEFVRKALDEPMDEE